MLTVLLNLAYGIFVRQDVNLSWVKGSNTVGVRMIYVPPLNLTAKFHETVVLTLDLDMMDV